MSNQTRRISAIVILGVVIITTAFVVRRQYANRRANALKSAVAVDQAAVEQQMIRLHDAARADPHNKQAQWDLANFYLKYNLIDKAADQLAAIITLDRTDQDAQLKLAGICLAANQYPTAEFYYRQLTESNPKSILAWQGLGATLVKQRRYFEASAAATQAIALDKNNAGSRLLHATSLLDFVMQYSDPLMHTSELNIVRSELESLAKEMPNNADVFYQFGRVEMALVQRPQAIQQFERAHQLAPSNVNAELLLALNYRFTLRDDKALKVLQDAVAGQPDEPGLNDMLGRLLLDSTEPGAHERALNAFKIAVKGAPYDSKFAEHLGTAYDKLHDLKAARLAYERATQLDPYRSSPFQKLALVYTRLGEVRLANQASVLAQQLEFNEQQLVHITELSAKHPFDVDLHLIMAERYREIKMSNQARDEYLIVLKLDPTNKRVPNEFRTAFAATTIPTYSK